MAKAKWAPFPYPNKAFDYPGDKLEKAWPKLHAGDAEPYPDEARIVALLKANPKLGKATQAGAIADELADAWRAYHRGDFEAAHAAGAALGPIGVAVACKAMGIHATYLVDDDKAKLARFEAVAKLAEEAVEALPKEANAHYFRAFGWGRYSQLISVTKALSQGIAGRVKESLDQTLKLAPKHAEAHLALAVYHAEIVSKIGGMIASLTYGAKASTAEELIAKAQKLAPDSPIVHLEHGNVLLLLQGKHSEEAAVDAYVKATKMKPIEAMQALDVAAAKDVLE
jgi:tetratricopeptide (TPR) repeat protein